MKRASAKKLELSGAAPSTGLLAQMEQQRNLLELQNEELAKAHAALEISHQRFAELHEQAPIGYLTFDAQGCIRDINAEAERLLCTRRTSAIGKPFVVYVEPAERRKFLEHLWKMQRTASTVATDLRLAALDGTLRQVRMSTGRHRDAEGRSSLFLTAIEDVTALRAASADAAYLASIVQASQDAIASFTPEGIIQSWNPGAQQLFGYTASEMIGQHVSVLATPDRTEEVDRILKLGASGKQVPAFETVRRRKDGSLVEVEVSRSPIFQGDRVIAVAAIWRDISERKRAEESLRKHAELLSLAQDGARMGVFGWDLVTNRAYWTREMQALMGMELEDQPANLEPWLEAMHPDDRARLERVFDEWMGSKRQDASLQYRLSGDGTERWMEIRGRMIRDSDGRPLKMIGTNLDISARKEAEVALRQSEAKYRQLHDTMREAFVSVDMKGQITEFNSAYEEMLGYSGSELRQLTYLDLTPKKWHRFETRMVREKVIPDGFSGIYEKEYRRKDGTIFPVELHTFLIRNGNGEPEAMWAIVRDITERKRAELALQESEARFRMVLENSVDAAFRRNLQSDSYDYLSPSIESITGFKPEEFESLPMRTVTQMIHPADILHVRRAFKAATASGKPCRSLEYRFRCKDGSYRWLAQSFRILRDASRRSLYAVGTIRDISERKKMEEELRESQRLARSTVEAIPAQIAVVDKSGTIIDINTAWRRFARANGGTDKTTGYGVNYLRVCDKVHGMGRRDAARFAAGIRSVLRGDRKMFFMEYAGHSPSERRWFTGYVTPFAGEGDRRAVVAHVNITGVKLAEEKFRDVLESAPDAMVIVDGKGRIQMVNRQTEKMFGYTRRELTGRKLEILIPARLRRRHVVLREDYAAHPTSRHFGAGLVLTGRRKDGSEFPTEISLSPLQTEHGVLVCSAIRDVTERTKAEEAIRTLNAELDQRVAARTTALVDANKSLQQAIEERRRLEQEVIEISEVERQRVGQDLHDDLGQRLAGLWMFAASLEKNLRAQSSAEAESATKISGMLSGALALTRSLARGLQPVMPEAGGLMSALEDLAGRITDLFKIRCNLKYPKPVYLYDPSVATHVYRIAQEAVTNAARHAKAKRISIMLSSSHGKLRLSVKDDGTGVKQAGGNSNGMGIRTMTYRAEALGGSLVFRARRGGGTSVICTIPSPPEPQTKKP